MHAQDVERRGGQENGQSGLLLAAPAQSVQAEFPFRYAEGGFASGPLSVKSLGFRVLGKHSSPGFDAGLFPVPLQSGFAFGDFYRAVMAMRALATTSWIEVGDSFLVSGMYNIFDALLPHGAGNDGVVFGTGKVHDSESVSRGSRGRTHKFHIAFNAPLLVIVAVVSIVREQGLGLESFVLKGTNGIEDGGLVRGVGGMNADLGDNLGMRGVFVIATGFGEISLVADLLVMPIVMGVGIMRVGHGRTLGFLIDLYDNLFTVFDDLLLGKAHKQGKGRKLAGGRMILEALDKTQHFLGGSKQDFLVLAGLVACELGVVVLGRQIAVAQLLIESAVDYGVCLS